jgi:transposase
MYVRVVTSRQGEKTYRSVQLVESFRDMEKGGKPRTRVLLHLGNVDDLSGGKVDRLIDGLLRAVGRLVSEETGEIEVPEALDFGSVWAIVGVWQQLRIGTILKEKAAASRREFDLEAHIRLMVVNRLCDPRSKLGLLTWLEGVWVPGIDREAVTYDNLLRAMDFLIAQKKEVEREVFESVRTLFDEELEMVFYDLTSSYFEGERSVTAEDVRRYGYSRDHRGDRRQIVIGMVTTTDGIPIAHHVFAGNTLDRKTVEEVVKDLRERLGLSKVTFVGDRGILSAANREAIREAKMDYLIAHSLRRDADSLELLERCEKSLKEAREAGREVVFAAGMLGERPGDHFAVAYDPEIARTSRNNRERRIEKADAAIAEILERLRKAQDPTVHRRGRKLTADGARVRIHDYLRDHEIGRLYEVALDSSAPLGLTVKADEEARAFEERIDGILIVEGSRSDLTASEMVTRYKSLAEIERSWRSLKSTLRLRPVFHWTEERIRAHVFICVLALTVERVMRKKLAGTGTSVPAALELLGRIRAGRARIGRKTVPFLTNVGKPARECYTKLGVKVPKLSDVAEIATAAL